MSTFLADARQTVAPPRDGNDGLLPPLLVALTAVTGLVDSFSYLVLGHVFVAAGPLASRRELLLGVTAGIEALIALIILAAAAVTAVAQARNSRIRRSPVA